MASTAGYMVSVALSTSSTAPSLSPYRSHGIFNPPSGCPRCSSGCSARADIYVYICIHISIYVYCTCRSFVRAICKCRPHMQTIIIYKLGFDQDYFTFTLILVINIVPCSEFPWTDFMNYNCFQSRSPRDPFGDLKFRSSWQPKRNSENTRLFFTTHAGCPRCSFAGRPGTLHLDLPKPASRKPPPITRIWWHSTLWGGAP